MSFFTYEINFNESTLIYFTDNTQVSDNGIMHIVSLPKLKYLSIANLKTITGKYLKKMDNLEILECHKCSNLEDQGLCAIVQKSKLKLLDVKECKKITNKLLDTIVEELNMRERELSLLFIIEDTKIDVSQIKNIPHNLRITNGYKFPYYTFCKINDVFPEIGTSGAIAIDFKTEFGRYSDFAIA